MLAGIAPQTGNGVWKLFLTTVSQNTDAVPWQAGGAALHFIGSPFGGMPR